MSAYATVADKDGWDSYFWPGTQVLRNLPGVREQDQLNTLELMAAKSRTFELATGPLDGCFDLDHMQRIHRHLFQDIYEWAGKLRTSPRFSTAMVKGGPSPESIAAGKYTADVPAPLPLLPCWGRHGFASAHVVREVTGTGRLRGHEPRVVRCGRRRAVG
ncbi:MAG: Fic family protein [Bifidobacteriaceae bacterium]|nr:Fic family protein [Bifidobacteriaceae bacterium]